MLVRKIVRAILAALLTTLVLSGGQASAATAPAAATERTAAPTILTYDDGAAAEFTDAVKQGVTVWNDSVANVELRPVEQGQKANVRIIADNGWPRAAVTSLGNGTVYMGRQATDQGHNAVRIAAHELGHILGLPDRKPGPCSSLMSGSSAGTSCTNPYPNAAEKAEVERNFSSRLAELAGVERRLVFQD
ncbi:snapalysin family zinc-dependent metalloprotease [Streptomyces sp. KR80]|uniref:snapalysin family zinc-dependent metalloprotease n=1 Tax=Streptomyces sp. KR80 TaxID=3457426 RepID=UPI003FD53869